MRPIFALLTLAGVGIILADLAAHPEALKAGLNGLNGLLTTTWSAMLGTVPSGYNKVG